MQLKILLYLSNFFDIAPFEPARNPRSYRDISTYDDTRFTIALLSACDLNNFDS